MTEETKNIHQRLASAMLEVSYIQKEKKQGMQYSIVSHDAVTAKVRPVLLKCGIVYYPVRCEHTHNGNRAECAMTVRFVNIHDPQDYFDVPTFGYGIDGQDKGPGKAMSYAVKYALLKALGLETGDDADHDNMDHTRDDPAKRDEEIANARTMLQSATTLEELKERWSAIGPKMQSEKTVSEFKEARKADLQAGLITDPDNVRHMAGAFNG